jgi:hypothetical protein
MALQPFVGPWPLFGFLILYTVGRTRWTGDQPVARPLPVYRINAHNTGIHALSGIRAHDPSVRAGEDSSCLRPLGHCDRRNLIYLVEIRVYEVGVMRGIAFWRLTQKRHKAILGTLAVVLSWPNGTKESTWYSGGMDPLWSGHMATSSSEFTQSFSRDATCNSRDTVF